MSRPRTLVLLLAALSLSGPHARAQVGPLPPDTGEPAPIPEAEWARPVADIHAGPSLDQPGERPATRSAGPADESSIPLGARKVSDILPRLSSPADADSSQTQPAPVDDRAPSRLADVTKTVGALVLVIALILALAWGVRRVARSQGGLGAKLTAGGRAPSGVLEVLGRYPVSPKLSLVVLRFDRRVLLLAQSHAAGGTMSTLCELNDPSDVASVLAKTSDADEVNSLFREAIAHAEQDVRTALAPETHVPLHEFDPGVRTVTATPDGDRVELLRDDPPPAFEQHPRQEEISPLRRRLDALRAGVGV
ncbi:MAG: FliO/MopB family protein [Phycisphaerales bacterium JB059]